MLMFANYEYLYLLFLVPVFILGYGVLRLLRARKVKAFGDPALVEVLMPSWSRSKGWVKVVLFSLAFAFFAIGLARPRTGAKLAERNTKGAEIIVALDVSNSMLAQDYSPNRLERAKLSIARLTERLQDDRIGLVIFAGTSFVQLPVTTDYVSAKMFLGSIDTGSIPVQGTAIGDAIRLSIKSFSAQSEKSRVIVVISDGENHEDDAVGAAKKAYKEGIRVCTIGLGGSDGAPIPMNSNGTFRRDNEGNVVITRLNEQMLKDIAEAGKGVYVNGIGDIDKVYSLLENLEKNDFDEAVFNGSMAQIPVMIGYNKDDMGILAGESVDRFCAVRDSLGCPVFEYEFLRELPTDEAHPASAAGAFHSAELWYMFGTLGRSWRPFVDADYALSSRMLDAWTSFCRTGNPGWPAYKHDAPYKQLFDIEPAE